jgi:hypothetical protein
MSLELFGRQVSVGSDELLEQLKNWQQSIVMAVWIGGALLIILSIGAIAGPPSL